jgi:hypothetical protein
MISRCIRIGAMVIILGLMFSLPAQAVKIKLQSGREMEGEVTEKTNEYIKLKNDKGEYKIQLKLIDQDVTVALNAEKK